MKPKWLVLLAAMTVLFFTDSRRAGALCRGRQCLRMAESNVAEGWDHRRSDL